MADDLSRRRPEDPRQINIHEQWEINYWCAKWGITPQQLADAVRRYGTWTHHIAAGLGKAL